MKRFTILFLFLISSFNVFNQETKQLIGIEFSPTVRTLYGNVFGSIQKMSLGFSVGFNYQYMINSYFSIKSGITYDKKGTVAEIEMRDIDGNLIGTTDFKMNYNYLVIPVLASITDKKDHFYISSGPYIGYLISLINKHGSVGDFPEDKSNNTEGAERIDFGWIFGIGYNFNVSGRVKIDLGMREDLGLVNLADGENKIKTNSLGFRVGLKYNIN
jgi:opacity protein-like surface antigen